MLCFSCVGCRPLVIKPSSGGQNQYIKYSIEPLQWVSGLCKFTLLIIIYMYYRLTNITLCLSQYNRVSETHQSLISYAQKISFMPLLVIFATATMATNYNYNYYNYKSSCSKRNKMLYFLMTHFNFSLGLLDWTTSITQNDDHWQDTSRTSIVYKK